MKYKILSRLTCNILILLQVLLSYLMKALTFQMYKISSINYDFMKQESEEKKLEDVARIKATKSRNRTL